MKSFLKKIIPRGAWEWSRYSYAYSRRLFFDGLGTFSFAHPIKWAQVFSLIRTVRPVYTMVPAVRLKLLYELSQKITAEHIPGDIVECGVYNGGSAAIMTSPQTLSAEPRTTWLFDSFEGLPAPTSKDGVYEQQHYYKGWCAGSVQKVEEIFRKLNLDLGKVRIIKGWFDQTFPREASNIENIALLHIDADWYESVKICLDTFYPKVVRGGYIEFDDYGTWEGCKKAVDEYFAREHINVPLLT